MDIWRQEMKHNLINMVRKKPQLTEIFNQYFLDSQYVHSDVDEIEEELMGSDDDDEEQSSDDFRKRVDFGK